MHDPIYEVQALQTGYDPNLYAIKGEQPASQSQANLSHMQKMPLDLEPSSLASEIKFRAPQILKPSSKKA